jgi:hypothetical protein
LIGMWMLIIPLFLTFYSCFSMLGWCCY